MPASVSSPPVSTDPGSAPGSARLAALYRYPVKGLSAEALGEVALTPGETLPFDRAYAIENGAGRFDPDAPRHLPKVNFLMLMRHERLAALETRYDAAAHVLTILRQGRQVARGALDQRLGRQLIEQFLAAFMKAELSGAPRIVQAPGHSFCDVPAKWLHIVNLASVRELERVMGRRLDPLRFRANLYVDGLAPWREFDWVGRDVRIGAARLSVVTRCERCEATNVDPGTAARDTAIPAVLQRTWGHCDFGVYATVIDGGAIGPGDALGLDPIAPAPQSAP